MIFKYNANTKYMATCLGTYKCARINKIGAGSTFKLAKLYCFHKIGKNELAFFKKIGNHI